MTKPFLIVANTDAAAYSKVTGLKMNDGFVLTDSGRPCGLYPWARALQIMGMLDDAGIAYGDSFSAQSVAHGLRVAS